MTIGLQILLLLVVNYAFMIKICSQKKIAMPQIVLYSLAVIPIFGPLCYILLQHTQADPTNAVDPNLTEYDSNSWGLTKIEKEDEIVSVEEAMLLNSPQEQRQLVKKILRQENLEDYLPVLQSDLLYSDVEVTHYATIALVEIQNNYEKELQMLRQKHSDYPGDQQILIELIQKLMSYIESGLPEGNLLTMYREEYSLYLHEICSKEEVTSVFYGKMIDNYLHLQDFNQANEWLIKMEERWPNSKTLQILKMEYFVQTHNSFKLRETLDIMGNQIKPMPADVREKLDFWQ